jgi:UDP-N-acetylmuramate--alanine ligase
MSTSNNIELADYTIAQLQKLKVHFIGIGGAGMSGIARIMLAKSVDVSGSDAHDSQMLLSLKTLGAKIYIGHDAAQVKHAQLVVVSAAISESNPELVEAKKLGIPIASRASALAWLLKEKSSIAIAGTHGKTTTTAMLTVALQSAGEDPSFAIGGTINSAGTNAHSGSGKFFVVEADESDGSFLAYKPTAAIITNIEMDHVDHFSSEAQLFAAFNDFINSIQPGGALILCGDDAGCQQILKTTDHPKSKVITYGQAPENDFQLTRVNLLPNTSSALILHNGRKVGELNLVVPGIHNLLNALAAFAAASVLGASVDQLLTGLASFSGTRRRFELKGEVNGIKVIDDYGHHPTELFVTLTAARNLVGAGKLYVVFQPHRYSRTAAFAKEFAKVLDLADFVYLLEVYAASEAPIEGVSSLLISKAMNQNKTKFEPSMLQVVIEVANAAKPGDLIIILGAGDVSTLSAPILEQLATPKA